MKLFILLAAMTVWVGASLNSAVDDLVYLLWFVAAVATWYSTSMVFMLLVLTCAVSYRYMAIDSGGVLTASILPWLFWISLVIILLQLFLKYSAFITANGDGGGGFFDGDIGGGD